MNQQVSIPNDCLRITLAQYDVAWEDKAININHIARIASQVAHKTDIIMLPEMCTTAFTFNITNLAETIEGNTIAEFKRIAKENNLALCGSFLCVENKKYYNRGFFIDPTNIYFYDKRHLFRMGQEGDLFEPGDKKLILHYRGFNICLQICYDLRFPVWSRNENNSYDILLFAGNWPLGRKDVWTTLLKARAIENMSYVCGVNRIGTDKNNIKYAGSSMFVNPRGQALVTLSEDEETIETISIEMGYLNKERKNFPVWKDADKFSLELN